VLLIITIQTSGAQKLFDHPVYILYYILAYIRHNGDVGIENYRYNFGYRS